MLVVDFIIILGAIVGFKRGFTRSLLSAVGLVLIVILSFLFKNQISVLFYENLPFFKFGGVLKGVTVLNMFLYELIAFFVVALILSIILRILLVVSTLLEKVLEATILLGIPSKILGAIVGALEAYVITFLILYMVSLPLFNNSLIKDSKFKDAILYNTPILTGLLGNSMYAVDEFALLRDKYESEENANQFNYEALDLMLKYKIVTVHSVDILIRKDKLKIENIDYLLNQYRTN